MPSSISSTLMFSLIPFILILISTPNSTCSSALLKQACNTASRGIDPKTCLEVLKPLPKVASAKNLLDLSIAIVETGILRSTDTLTHIESLLKKTGTSDNLKGAMKSCKEAYDGVVGSFKSARSEIEIKEYDTATYDVLIASTDDVQVCEKALASKGVKDEIISKGNKIVPIFGFSAFNVIDELSRQ